MIEYEQKNKKFSLNKLKESIPVVNKRKILNSSICQDSSTLIISTEKNSCMIFEFQDILNLPKILNPSKKYDIVEKKVNNFIYPEKKQNKKDYLVSQMIFEIKPTMEEGILMAIGLGKRVNIISISSGKSFEVKHGEDSVCKFIQWENDLLICAFENRVIKIIKNYYFPFKSFKDEDKITAMKIVHWQKSDLLVIGNNKKVKILDFLTISDNEFKSFVISKLEGNINIIETKNQYILFCSKENKIIYCYHFLNNDTKPKMLFEINLYNYNDLNEQEIINVKLISNEGIIVSLKNEIYLFYIKDNKCVLNSIYKESPDNNISFSHLIYDRKKYYLIYALQDKLKIFEILISQKNSSNIINSTPYDIELHKKMIYTCINTLLNRKNEFAIKKLDEYSLQIETEFAWLKLEFNLNDLSLIFSVLDCHDAVLKRKLEEEIEKIKLAEEEKINDYNEYVTEKIIFLIKVINSDISESFISEGESEIDKLKKEQFLYHYETFKNWKEIAKAKIPIKNLFNDDEYEFDLDNKIMKESIKNLVPKWNFNFNELNIDNAFDFANSNFYSSFYDIKIDKNKKNKDINEEINNDTAVIYKLNKDSIKIYLDSIEERKKIHNENIIILVDILDQIKYFFQEISSQNSFNLIKIYRESILDILVKLESTLNFIFLFICIVPIAELIFNEITKRSNIFLNMKNLSLKDLLENKNRRNSDNKYDKKIIKKNSSKISFSSDNDDLNDAKSENDDLFLEFENDEENNPNNYSNYNNFKYNCDNFKKGKDINNINLKLGFNNNKNYIEEKRLSFTKNNDVGIIRTKKKNLTNRVYKNNLSFSSNIYEKNLIESLTSSFCNCIIDYVTFFSEELKLLNVDSPDERLIDFFYLAIIFYENKDIYNEICEIKNIIKL